MIEQKRGRGRPRKIHNKINSPEKISVVSADNQIHSDNWENSLTGLGQLADRSIKTKYSYSDILDDGTLTDMYMGGGLATRIVNIIADDMTREWVYIGDKDSRFVVEDAVRSLALEENINTALRWQRLYGGSLLIVGADDGRTMDQPLNEKAIKSINYFRPVDSTCVDLSASQWEKNPLSPRFGKVNVFRIRYNVYDTYVNMDIHYTRLIEFHNDPYPSGQYKMITTEQQYWGMPALQTVNESLRDLGGITQNTVNILYDFVSGVYTLKGLSQLLAQDADGKAKTALTKRFEAINMAKSAINAAILDEGETYTKNFTTVSGLPELIDRFMLQLSGSTGIPVTRLYGRSPAGLNATGEADIRNYYDIIEAQQRNRLYVQLMRCFQLICIWKGLDFSNLNVTFNSLYQLTETEKTQIEKDEATTRQTVVNTQITLINNNLRDPEAVARELGYEDEMPDDIGESSSEINSGDNPVNE